jgi:hypothetical protein
MGLNLAPILITGLVCDDLHVGLSTLFMGQRYMKNTLLACRSWCGVYQLSPRRSDSMLNRRYFSTPILLSRGRRLRGSRPAMRPAKRFFNRLTNPFENSLGVCNRPSVMSVRARDNKGWARRRNAARLAADKQAQIQFGSEYAFSPCFPLNHLGQTLCSGLASCHCGSGYLGIAT